MTDDNVVNITKRIKARQMKQSGEEWPDPVPFPRPTLEEIDSFMRVLTFIQQQSPDGTGEITFDDFIARVSLDHGRIDWDEDDPQMRYATVIEALFPIAFTSIDETDKILEEEVSFDEIVLCAYDIIGRLGGEESNSD